MEREDYDPVRYFSKDSRDFFSLRTLENGFYGMPSVAASLGMMALPGGTLMMFGAMEDSAYRDLRDHVMQSQQAAHGHTDEAAASLFAESMKSIVAAPQTLLERFQSMGLVGRTPLVKEMMKAVGDRVSNRLLRAGVAGLTSVASETLMEESQYQMSYMVQELAAAMPGMTGIEGPVWSNGKDGAFDGFWTRQATTFISMAPLSIPAGKGSWTRDKRSQAFAEASPTHLAAFGLTQEGISKILEATTKGQASLNEAVDLALAGRDPFSETAKAAVEDLARLEEERMMAAETLRIDGNMPRFVSSPDGSWTLYDKEGQELGKAATHEEALRMAAAHTDAIDAADADQIAYLATMLEAGSITAATDEEGVRQTSTDFRPAQRLTLAQAIAESGENAIRIAAQLRARELANGGDGSLSDIIFGSSTTRFEEGVRHTTNRLQQGASVLTVFHEETHGFWKEALATGRISRQEAITFLRAVDTVLSSRTGREGQTLRLLPEGDGEITDVHLDEAIAELREAEILRTRKDGGLPPGLVSRNLAAIARLSGQGTAGKFKSFFDGIRSWFGVALDRSVTIKRRLADGSISQAEYDGFFGRLTGKEGASSVLDAEGNIPISTSFSISPKEAIGIRNEIEGQTPLIVSTSTLPDISKPSMVKQWAKDNDIYGETSHPEIDGPVLIAPSSIKSEIAHRLSPKKAASLAVMKQLIPQATYLESNRRNPDVLSHRLAATVEIDGQLYVARIVVDEDLNGNRLYNHELSDLKQLQETKSPRPLQSGAAQGEQRTGWQEFEDTAKLLQWIYSVKETDLPGTSSASSENSAVAATNPQPDPKKLGGLLEEDGDEVSFSMGPDLSGDAESLITEATARAREKASAKDQGSIRQAGRFWLSLHGVEGVARLPELRSKDFKGLAAEANEVMPALTAKPWGELFGADITQVDDGHGTAYIHVMDGKVWVDTSGAGGPNTYGKGKHEQRTKASMAPAVYQIAQAYAKNNGLKFVPDPVGVSDIAKFRRWPQLLSSAIRMGDTSHIDGTKDVEGWKDGDHEHNAGLLAMHEYEYVRHFFPEIDGLHLSGDSATIVDHAGAPVSRQTLADLLVGERHPSRLGIGETTLRRALVTGQVAAEGRMESTAEAGRRADGERRIHPGAVKDFAPDLGSGVEGTNPPPHALSEISYSIGSDADSPNQPQRQDLRNDGNIPGAEARPNLSSPSPSLPPERQEEIIAEVLADALAGKNSRGRNLGAVSANAVTMAAEAGQDISGFVKYIEPSTTKHVDKRHGKAENRPGQRAITLRDFLQLPDILDNPDKVEAGDPKHGRDRLIFSKVIDDRFIVVAEVRTGKRRLAFVTMRIQMK